MALTDVSITFNNVLKSPLTYTVILLGVIITMLINPFTEDKDKAAVICEKEKAELRLQLVDANKRYNDVVTALLVKQGVIDKLVLITDSVKKDNNEQNKQDN